MTAKQLDRWLKPLVFTALLLPLMWLAGRGVAGDLGANPIEAITRFLGDWALRLLLLGLAITPLVKISGWNWPMRRRRVIGLFTFFYAVLHLLAYVVLDQFFDWTAIWADIVKRPYITIGMVTLLILLPLAVTSTKRMMGRLGFARWKALHRLVYVAGVGGVAHYYLLVKVDLREPLAYAGVLVVLLGYRLFKALQRRWQMRSITVTA